MAERTKKKKEWFIKDVGKGAFRLKSGKKVKPMERFQAFEDDIPEAHRDLVHKLDGTDFGAEAEEEEKKEEKVVEAQGKYVKKERSAGWWDIFDPSGNKVNEKAVREEEADNWLESLNA